MRGPLKIAYYVLGSIVLVELERNIREVLTVNPKTAQRFSLKHPLVEQTLHFLSIAFTKINRQHDRPEF